MGNRARDRHWVAEPRDMLEKLRHDRERLREGIENLHDNPGRAQFAAYDFFTTARHVAKDDDWLDLDMNDDKNGHFCLAGDVANGVKHFRGKIPKEETREEGDFSPKDFSPVDFHTPDLELHVTEKKAQEAEEGARNRGLDPKGIVQGQGMTQDHKKISVLVLADRLIESLEQEIQERSST